jgi:hypothetical protein
MKTRIALAALSLAALSFAASQSASAQSYYGRLDRDIYRIERDNARIHNEKRDLFRDYRALARERRERNYYAAREREAALHGHYWAAEHFAWRRRHEEREIAGDRRDIRRDREGLAWNRFKRHEDVERLEWDARH